MKGPPVLLLLIVSSLALACGAVYPELKTSVRPPGSQTLSPPPPDDVLFLRFASATIPERTRDGRRWSSRGVDAPDPFAKVFVNDVELFRTPVQPDTLTPTWRDAERHNYRVPKGATVRIELWDKNPINNQPICVRRVQNIHSHAAQGELDMECESGARIKLRVEPAHGLIGLGFAYELRSRDVVITRVVADSPAGRVGVVVGDFVVAIEGRKVREMKEGEPRSLINANGPTGLTMTLRHKDGSTVDVSFKEGALYPVKSDDIPIP